MLSCKDISQQASDYLDSKLSFGQRVNFKVHIFMCVHCRRYLKQFKLTIGTLAGLKPDNLPDTNIEKIIELIKQNETNNTANNK